jgi:hypothetical protein
MGRIKAVRRVVTCGRLKGGECRMRDGAGGEPNDA